MWPAFLLKFAVVRFVLRLILFPFKLLYWLCAAVGFCVLLTGGLLYFGVVKLSDIPFSSHLESYVSSDTVSDGIDTVGAAVDVAIDKAGDVLDALPGDVPALYYRGVAFYKAGSYEAAVTDFNRVLQLEGGHKKALMYLGHCNLAQEDYATALVYYDTALVGITDASLAAEIYLHQGRALQRQGNISDAVHAYEQALIARPGYEEALEAKAAIGG